MAQWFYAKGTQQLGPVSDGELRQKIASGEVQGTDSVWKDGMASRQPVNAISELSGGGRSAPSHQYAQPQQQYPQQPYAPQSPQTVGYAAQTPIPNYLVQSILVTLFCCMPLGVVSIIFASQVSSKQAAGDYAGALEASKKAKQFSTWGLIGGIVVIGLALVLNILAAIMASGSSRY